MNWAYKYLQYGKFHNKIALKSLTYSFYDFNRKQKEPLSVWFQNTRARERKGQYRSVSMYAAKQQQQQQQHGQAAVHAATVYPLSHQAWPILKHFLTLFQMIFMLNI